MKRFLFSTIFFFSFFALPAVARAATEFVSVVDPGNGSGTDYTSLSTWEAGVQTDLTAAATQVFSGTRTGTINDNTTVYLCRLGAYQTHTGRAAHVTATQILIDGITGAATEAANDIWYTNNTCNSAAYFTLSGAQAGGDSAIAVAKCRNSNGTADTAAFTIDGWTTSATNYIKIWTDPSENYRHKGVWSAAYYNLTTNDASFAMGSMYIMESYVRVDGLQIQVSSPNTGNTQRGIAVMGQATGASDIRISNNIIVQGTSGGDNLDGIRVADADAIVRIWNNIIYDFTAGYANAIAVGDGGSNTGTAYVYNNTIVDNDEGVLRNAATTVVVKNNAMHGNTSSFNGTFDATSGYNVTDINTAESYFGQNETGTAGAGTGGSTIIIAGKSFLSTVKIGMPVTDWATYAGVVTSVVSDTQLSVVNVVGTPAVGMNLTIYRNMIAIVSFANEAGNDFHLSVADYSSRNKGTDLSADANLSFNTDIDSVASTDGSTCPAGTTETCSARPTGISWDVGADEVLTRIYRSMAPSATSALVTGSGNNLTISGTTATFASPPGNNIGVGDAIQYDSDNNGSIDAIAFIAGRTSTTVYTVQNTTGITPTATAAADQDWSIFRAYTSLANAEDGIENSGLADAIEQFDAGWSAAGGKNIASSSEQWSIACYANGTTADGSGVWVNAWTTTVNNYLKFYTPYLSSEVGISQRHQGKWDDSKYKIQLTASGANQRAILVNINNAVIEGLQINITNTGGYDSVNGLVPFGTLTTDRIIFASNIIKGTISGNGSVSAGILNNDNVYLRIYNNIVYGFKNTTDPVTYACAGITMGAGGYVYNNTVYDSYRGIVAWGNPVIAINNVVQGNTDGFTSTAFNASSDYNVSDLAADYPNGIVAHNKVSTAVTFVDAANRDLHLAAADQGARDVGTNLSATTTLAFTTDVDGSTRPSSGWDKGADEGSIYAYYSVGDSAGDLRSGSPTLSISSSTATFSVSQDNNIGVGDRITYNTTNYAYIIGKTSGTVWTVVSATGGIITGVSGATVNAINHTFSSLSAAEAGASGSSFLNTSDLVTNNYILNFPCYYDSASDTTAVTVDGWTTGPVNYIKIYTATSTTAEVNTSQRHKGKWDSTKYNLSVTASSAGAALEIPEEYVIVDGLQISYAASATGLTYGGGIIANYSNDSSQRFVKVSNTIIRKTGKYAPALLSGLAASGYVDTLYARNNLIYDFSGGASQSRGIFTDSASSYLYNNTIVNSEFGFKRQTSGAAVAKNNIAYSCKDGYNGTFDSSSDYNISDIASDQPAAGTHDKTGTAVVFEDKNNSDFHLAGADTAARDAGTDLSADAYLSFGTDFESNARPTSNTWDIGADEGAVAIYRSVAPDDNGDNNLAALATGGSNALTVSGSMATFATALPTNVGVGDVVQYDSNNNGSIGAGDTLGFIAARIDSQHYTIKTATGTVPIARSADTTWSIFRAYTSLFNAEAGTENAAINASLVNFDTGNQDLVTNNQQWNIAAYANGSTADTTALDINGWTTGTQNYLKVYTPYLSTEVGASQRHAGKWDDTKYHLTISTDVDYVIYTRANYSRFEGLQVFHNYIKPSGNYPQGISVANAIVAASEVYISNNILQGAGTYTNATGAGIWISSNSALSNVKVYNNIVYNFYGSGLAGIRNDNTNNVYAYNNTVYHCQTGFYTTTALSMMVKNNLVQDTVLGFYTNLGPPNYFMAGSDYNISNIAEGLDVNPGTHSYHGVTNVSFIDATNRDLHLNMNDTAAKNKGIKLVTYSDDANLSFTNDVDSEQRAGDWSIGADEPYGARAEMPHTVDTNANIDNGLVLYQSFDGKDMDWATSTAEARDKSGSNNHGDVVGAAQAIGKKGQALYFDGISDVVNIPGDLFESTNSMSVSYWFYITAGPAVTSYADLATKGYTFATAIHNSGGSLYLHSNYGNGSSWQGGFDDTHALSVGRWYYATFVLDGTQTRIYLDGQLSATGSGGTTGTTAQPLNLGYTGNAYFNGNLDEVRVYNRAITTTEITQLYNLGKETINASQAGKNNNGLIGHWTFDGQDVNMTTHVATDRGSTGNNGTISTANQGIGKLGQALLFNGSSGYVSVPNNSAYNFGTGAFTLSAWVKPTSDAWNTEENIFYFLTGSPTYAGWSLDMNQCSHGRLCFYDGSSSQGLVSGITANVWNYITLVRSGTTVTIYVNGSSIGTLTIQATIPSNLDNPLLIGAADTIGSRVFNGSIDDVRIYNRALSTSEVGDLYRLGHVKVNK